MTKQVPAGREIPIDKRRHVESMLMRESLLDKQVMASTESPSRADAAILPRHQDWRTLHHRPREEGHLRFSRISSQNT